MVVNGIFYPLTLDQIVTKNRSHWYDFKCCNLSNLLVDFIAYIDMTRPYKHNGFKFKNKEESRFKKYGHYTGGGGGGEAPPPPSPP